MKKVYLLLYILLAVLSACANDEESASPNPTGSGIGNGGNNDNTNNSSVPIISYNANGVWARDCRVYNNLYWEITTLDISGNSGTKYIDLYSTDRCTKAEMEYTLTYTVTTPNLYTHTVEGKALQVDLTYNSVRQTLLTKNAVGLYNTNNICGFNDWAIKQSKEIIDTACFNQPLEYTIFLVKDATQLLVGDTSVENNGSTSLLRPTTLASEIYNKL